MGSFYTNVQVRLDDYKEVANSLGRCNALPAYISKTTSNKWLSVYPKTTESQDQNLIKGIVSSLSAELDAAVLGMLVHDSDVFCYVLSEKGRMLDVYDSEPGYFSGSSQKPSGGKLATIAGFCISGTTEFELAQLLYKQRKQVGPKTEEPFWNNPNNPMWNAMQEGNIEKIWDMMSPGSGKHMARAMGLRTDENGKVNGVLGASDSNLDDVEKALGTLNQWGGADEIFRGDSLARRFGEKLGLKDGRANVGYNYLQQGQGNLADLIHIDAK